MNAANETALVYTSSDQNIVRVGKDGTVTAAKIGEATIRCEAADNPYDQYYKDMIVECIKTFQRVKRKKVKELLWEKLPDILTEKQKEAKITTLLTSLRKKGIIQTDSPNQQTSCWILVGDENSNKND